LYWLFTEPRYLHCVSYNQINVMKIYKVLELQVYENLMRTCDPDFGRISEQQQVQQEGSGVKAGEQLPAKAGDQLPVEADVQPQPKSELTEKQEVGTSQSPLDPPVLIWSSFEETVSKIKDQLKKKSNPKKRKRT